MRIVGNLDVETTWARMDAAARRARGEKAPSPDDPRFALPEPVMRKISAAATLLRVFAQSEETVLWTPRPVDPDRMPHVDFWMPRVRLESGPMPVEANVWWGRPTEIAARVNHRLFAWETRRRHGDAGLPGAAVVRTIEDLENATRELSSLRGVDAGWVAKAPYSAAGRLRVRGTCVGLSEPARAQASRLLELQGMLLFEPWLDRTVDFGVICDSRKPRVWTGWTYRLDVDSRGRFVGISEPLTGLGERQATSIQKAAVAAGEALRAEGYRDRFGIDGYVYSGGRSLQGVSEINARLTFGWVAARITEMAGETLQEIRPGDPTTFRFGRGAPPVQTIPLLLPGADDDTSAWLETPIGHGV